MELLELWSEDRLLLRFRPAPLPFEIGSAPGCDLTLPDPELPPRAYLLTRARSGPLQLMELSHCATASEELSPTILRCGAEVALGRWYRLRYTLQPAAARSMEPGTEEIDISTFPPGEVQWKLHWCASPDSVAGCLVPQVRPLRIGTAPDNDLVLHDPTVSRHHLRLEPRNDGTLWVRDLNSRNGTWLDGARVRLAELQPGSQLRVGRTRLWVERRLVLEPSSSAAEDDPNRLVARSQAMRQVLRELRALAKTDWPLLLLGESGVGKERLARWVHEHSLRRSGPLVVINAGALPTGLLDSELFGHERGAFTGAQRVHRGVFEQADGGTLLLDEIGELPSDQQARLLRVVESGRVRRVGGEREFEVDVRLLSATHRDLRAMVQQDRFRGDLYCRLARIVVRVPSLRERLEDLEPLAEAALLRIAERMGPYSLAPEAVDRLLLYPWPGNVRELHNVVLAAAALAPSPTVTIEDVERALQRVALQPEAPWSPEGLRFVLARHEGNVTKMACALGVPRTTLRDRLRSAGLKPKASEARTPPYLAMALEPSASRVPGIANPQTDASHLSQGL